MSKLLLIALIFCKIVDGLHFNGGTIRWEPINATINSSIVSIRIIQTYSWTYPVITCATNVPISTNGRSSQNVNLTCVADCSADGGYSAKPIDILTDCQTISTSLGMMTSQKSKVINLTADAHFYLGFIGAAWVSLNNPAKSGLEWSIVCSMDLRMRPDGLINTPPVASVVSPQYAIVNQTTQITIPVSDVNAGDDVRCRWSTYTPGYRRRKRTDDEDHSNQIYKLQAHEKVFKDKELIHIRKKRKTSCKNCGSTCVNTCPCSCSGCTGTTCSGSKCSTTPSCPVGTTTVETPGTIASTISYVHRQAIDECGGICYPQNLPNDTTLSGCTISFKGLIPNTWYGIAVQVEDFINSTSNTSMSSVPVQFLIYVMPTPTCGLAPIILPLNQCLEVQMGVFMSFNISAETLCNPNILDIDSIIVTSSISGMDVTNTTITSPTNSSISYVTFTWTPQASQHGTQQLCVQAITDEQLLSQPYCITFNVVPWSTLCAITTTTSTTTATVTTTTSATTTTSSSSSSSSSTSTTSTTTTTVTTTTKKKSPGNPINWPLIVGLSLLALMLALCCCCCCLYWLLRGPAARHRRRQRANERPQRSNILSGIVPNRSRINHRLIHILGIDKLQKKYLNYTALNTSTSVETIPLSELPNYPSNFMFPTNNPGRIGNLSTSSTKQGKSISVIRLNNNEKPTETGNTWIKSSVYHNTTPQTSVTVVRANKSSTMLDDEAKTPSISSSKINRISVTKIPRQKTDTKRSSSISSINVNKLEYSLSKMHPRKRSTGSEGVTVTKLPRNSITN